MNQNQNQYHLTRISIAAEVLRAGVGKSPVMHTLLDIIEEAAFYLGEENTPPESLTGEAASSASSDQSAPSAPSAAQPRRKSPGGRRMRRSDLAADLQEVITAAGCETVQEAITELLQCDIRPATIVHVLKCTEEEFAALRDGKADAGLIYKFLAVFKLRNPAKEA